MLILISDAFDKSLPEKLSVFGTVTDDTSRLAEADVILVRSKTKCTKEYIDQAVNCKLIIGILQGERNHCGEHPAFFCNRSSRNGLCDDAFHCKQDLLL